MPGSLLTRLIDYGFTPGFASASARRRTVDHTDIAEGCVDLSVHSVVRPQFALQRP